MQLTDVGQVVFLQGQKGAKQGSRSQYRLRKSGKPQLRQRLPKVAFQHLLGICRGELSRLLLVHAAGKTVKQGILQHRVVGGAASPDDLAGSKPSQLAGSRRGIGAAGDIESTGGQVAEGQAAALLFPVDTGDVVVLALLQHAAFRDGAGGDNPGHLPLHQPLGQGRVLCLLADGHLIALAYQSGDVGIHGVIGNAAHGGLLLLGLVPVPGCEGQIQLPGSQPGVLVEHLVEVTQTEKQDTVLILFLDGVVLLAHGGKLCVFFFHADSPKFVVFTVPAVPSGSRWWSR